MAKVQLTNHYSASNDELNSKQQILFGAIALLFFVAVLRSILSSILTIDAKTPLTTLFAIDALIASGHSIKLMGSRTTRCGIYLEPEQYQKIFPDMTEKFSYFFNFHEGKDLLQIRPSSNGTLEIERLR